MLNNIKKYLFVSSFTAKFVEIKNINMKTINEAARDYASRHWGSYVGKTQERVITIDDFKAGCKFAQQWINVEYELPETPIEEEGIFYSEYLNIKVKGYNHPFVGYYVKANDDEFFDFIFQSIQKEIKQSEITHFRPIEFK